MHIEQDRNVVSICPATEEFAMFSGYYALYTVLCTVHDQSVLFLDGCVELEYHIFYTAYGS